MILSRMGLALCIALPLVSFASPTSERADTTASVSATVSFPRIAMFWSPAKNVSGNRWSNIAKHDVAVMNIDHLDLWWKPFKHDFMVESLDSEKLPQARRNLQKILRNDPSTQVFIQVLFFEVYEGHLPPEHKWWLRDENGNRVQFWPGAYRADITQPDYIAHVARRAAAVYRAFGGSAGIYFDNGRTDPQSRKAWISLLKQVRRLCGNDVRILVNAGHSAENLNWIAPHVNGLQFEDAVHHLPDPTDENPHPVEMLYSQIAALEHKTRKPRCSVNEVYGASENLSQMRREMIRTLVYTNAAYLYAKGPHGHKHPWYPSWDIPLGVAVDPPVTARSSKKIVRRRFENGEVIWIPAHAEKSQAVSFDKPVRNILSPSAEDTVSQLTLKPNRGAVLLYQK